MRYTKVHMYTHLGYAVVIVDSIGSTRRGIAFEAPVKHCMGTVEIEDQVKGISVLIQKVEIFSEVFLRLF
jgi:dipeptidyl aminopeptidase/acylaminoacyl peptidase